ncbi:LytTR family DNA-binding domain-containing protein [Hahella sp. SMD15-11]|uniref:LytTR family DNA-binding domain-containing protein n=1 Tax=Thermohahella caldifontis TaxID=3142973 RepID=A0AB39USS5_9GAMM
MRVLVVDDEPLARGRLVDLLERIPGMEVVGEAADGHTALDMARRLHPEVVLLDIRMPGMDGLSVARELAASPRPPAVIFCTAYDDKALEAFRVAAVDYLVKPVRQSDLEAALQRARTLNQAQLAALESEPDTPVLVCQDTGGVVRVDVATLYYLMADQKYVTVVHAGGTCLTDQSLREIEQQIGDPLVRIHRNTLVNRHFVLSLGRDAEGHYLTLRNVPERLRVSRRLYPTVKALFGAA